MEVEGQEVRSQMQDLGCNNLSDLDQIIELEHEKFQKQFAAKGKGESDGGLRKMEEIYHLENLRSRFIALSSPSEKTEDGGDGDNKVVSGVINELVGEDASEKERKDVIKLMKEESCDTAADLDERISVELEYFQKYFVARGKAESEAGIKKSEELKRLHDLRFRFSALSTSVVSDQKVFSDEKEKAEVLRLMADVDCSSIEALDERIQDETDYFQKRFVAKGNVDSKLGLSKREEILRLEEIRSRYTKLFSEQLQSKAVEEENQKKKEKAEVLRLMAEVDCNSIEALDEIIQDETDYYQKRFVARGNVDSEAGLSKREEILRLEDIRSRYTKLFSEQLQSKAVELENQKKKEKAEVLRLLAEVDCNSIEALNERIQDETDYFQKRYASKGKANSEDAVRKGAEISHLEDIRSRYAKVFSTTPSPLPIPIQNVPSKPDDVGLPPRPPGDKEPKPKTIGAPVRIVPPRPKFSRSDSVGIRTAIRENAFTKYSDMPAMAEKTLKILQTHFNLEAFKKSEERSLLSEEDLPKYFKTLADQVRTEEYGTYVELHVEEVAKKYDELTECPIFAESDKQQFIKEKILTPLSAIRSKITAVNFAEISEIIDRNDKTSDVILDKDVIILLGLTGAGKSTTAQFLAGMKMVKKEKITKDADGLEIPNLYYEGEDSPELRHLLEVFQVGTALSCTRSINAVPLKDEVAKGVMLCDSPGFFDTDGPEKDISNGIGISRALRRCKSLRIVIVIGEMGDRLESIEKIASTLVLCMKEQLEQSFASFTFVFTKQNSKKEARYIAGKINSQKKAMETVQDRPAPHPSFIKLVEKLISYVNPNSESYVNSTAHFIDLDNDDHIDLLTLIMQTPPIRHPGEVIHDFVTTSSMASLREQFLIDSKNIQHALSVLDLPRIEYKMHLMQKLALYIDTPEGSNVYAECKTGILRVIEKNIKDFSSIFDRVCNPNHLDISPECRELIALAEKWNTLERLRFMHVNEMQHLGELFFGRLSQEMSNFFDAFRDFVYFDPSIKVHLRDTIVFQIQTNLVEAERSFNKLVALHGLSKDSVRSEFVEVASRENFDKVWTSLADHLVGNFKSASETATNTVEFIQSVFSDSAFVPTQSTESDIVSSIQSYFNAVEFMKLCKGFQAAAQVDFFEAYTQKLDQYFIIVQDCNEKIVSLVGSLSAESAVITNELRVVGQVVEWSKFVKETLAQNDVFSHFEVYSLADFLKVIRASSTKKYLELHEKVREFSVFESTDEPTAIDIQKLNNLFSLIEAMEEIAVLDNVTIQVQSTTTNSAFIRFLEFSQEKTKRFYSQDEEFKANEFPLLSSMIDSMYTLSTVVVASQSFTFISTALNFFDTIMEGAINYCTDIEKLVVSVSYAESPSEMVQHYQSILRIRQWSHCKSLIPDVRQAAEKVAAVKNDGTFEKNLLSCLAKALNEISKDKIESSTKYEYEQFLQIHFHASALSPPEKNYWDRLDRKVSEYAHDFEIHFQTRISAFYSMFPKTFAIFCTAKFDDESSSSPPEQLGELLRQLTEKVHFFRETSLSSDAYDRIYSKIPQKLLADCTRIDEVFSSKEFSDVSQIEQAYQAVTSAQQPSLAIYHTYCGYILDHMKSVKNLNAIKNFQQLIIAFTALDPYLEIKFDALRVKTGFYIKELVNDNKGKILNAIATYTFAEVAALVNEIQLSEEDMKEIRFELRRVLSECAKRLHTQVSSLDPSLLSDQSLIPVWTELTTLQNAAAVHWLIPEFAQKLIEATKAENDACKGKLLATLEKFEDYFESNSFLDMEKLLTKFSRILSCKEELLLLGEGCGTLLSDKFDALKNKLESHRVSTIELYDNDNSSFKDDSTLQALVNLRNAPLSKFKLAASEYKTYDGHFNKLYGAVIRTVNAELKDSVGNNNIESFESKIEILESLSKCYPECYVGELEQIVAKKKEELEAFKEDMKRQKQAQAVANNIRALVDNIKQYIRTKQYSQAHKDQKELEAYCLTPNYQKCMEDIQKGNIKQVLELLVHTWEEWYYYANTLVTEVNAILCPSEPSLLQWGYDKFTSIIQDNSADATSPTFLVCGICSRELYEAHLQAQTLCYSKNHDDATRDLTRYFCKAACLGPGPKGQRRYWNCCGTCYRGKSADYQAKQHLQKILDTCRKSQNKFFDLLKGIIVDLHKRIGAVLSIDPNKPRSIIDVYEPFAIFSALIKPFDKSTPKGQLTSRLFENILVLEWNNERFFPQQKFFEALHRILLIVSNHKNHFSTSLQSNNIKEIANILDIALETTSDEVIVMAKNVVNSYYFRVHLQKHAAGWGGNMHKHCEEMQVFCTNAMLYNEMCSLVLPAFNNVKVRITIPYIGNPATKTVNSGDRDQFYAEIWNLYSSVMGLSSLSKHCSIGELSKDCLSHMKEQISKFGVAADNSLKTLIESSTQNKQQFEEFNVNFDNLRAMKEKFDDRLLEAEARTKMEQIQNKFNSFLSQIKKDAFDSENVLKRASFLVRAKNISTIVPAFQTVTDTSINSFLDEILRHRQSGRSDIADIALQLQSEDDKNGGVSSSIIGDYKHFSRLLYGLLNEETQSFTIYDVLGLDKNGSELPNAKSPASFDALNSNVTMIEGDDINKKILFESYTKYDDLYKSIVQRAVTTQSFQLKELVDATTELVRTKDKIPYREFILKLLANIFAYWSLQDGFDAFSGGTGSVSSEEMKKFFLSLKHPHAAQIISIVRLLGVENPSMSTTGTAQQFADRLAKHLVQIGTGQGKSVTLAAISIVLSLIGCTVNCVCYSAYLSLRDFESFKTLFEAFKVKPYIKYGTFNKLCEDLINEKGNVRDLVEAILTGRSIDSIIKTPDNRPKVLLIDEVDVFFSPTFYGSTYNPIALLKDDTISQLIRYTWKARLDPQKLRYRNFIQSAEYLAYIKRFDTWKELMAESAKLMLVELRNFIHPKAIHNYVKTANGIAYTVQDGISDKKFEGFSTIFAYFKEFEAKDPKCVISESKLAEMLGIPLYMGSFSYAEIPKLYKAIMGVSGTLLQLGKEQRRIMADYGIKKYTYMPSTYGNSKRDIQSTMILKSDEYPLQLCNSITTGLQNKEVAPGKDGRRPDDRAVIVFFESMRDLHSFREKPVVTTNLNINHIRYMTEMSPEDPKEKQNIINNAVFPGSITFMTKAFGRGTDFICHSNKVKAAGGVHVIQTFLSEDVAEEVQIRGRTARQSNKGSFMKILDQTALEKFGITADKADNLKQLGGVERDRDLNGFRSNLFDRNHSDSLGDISGVSKEHQLSEKFVGFVLSKDVRSIIRFLLERNQAPPIVEGGGTSRTLVLMDATGSMSGCLTAAKNTVDTMFKRLRQVLDAKQISTIVQLQFATYRNYNVQESQLLEHSNWCTTSQQLKVFLDTQGPAGGLGNEAVEIGLAHAVQLHDIEEINQIALIGDMPPNTPEEVTRKRSNNSGGESYWSGTKFATATNYEAELQKIRTRGIVLHSFYVSSSARSVFQSMAEHTVDKDGNVGTCSELDVNSNAGAEMLLDTLSMTILKDSGGSEAVSEYIRLKNTSGFIA